MTNPISGLRSKALKVVYLTAAVIFLLVGVIGIFLPLLPTTPFLLLAAYCFNRGSKKFHHWLITHPVLGPPIQDWEKNKIIRKKAKLLATTMILFSSIYVLSKNSIPLVGKGAYSLVIMGALVFIWTRRSR